MTRISLQFRDSSFPYGEKELEMIQRQVTGIHRYMDEQSELGKDFYGWMTLPRDFNRGELKRICEVADEIRQRADALVVIGAGGSYIGSRAGLDMLGHSFSNFTDSPDVYYAGNQLSADYITDLLDVLEEKDFYLNVVSKSGSTLEVNVAFSILERFLMRKYGVEEGRKRIIVTTGADGDLRRQAEMAGYRLFDVPEDIGGRYSVLSAVGLLPMAVGGIDVDEVLLGARHGMWELYSHKLEKNQSYLYAVARQGFYQQGKEIEVLGMFEPRMESFGEWWRQLFAESEGKNGKGIYPSTAIYTRELHSLGQLIQDGRRNLFETIISVREPRRDWRLEGAEVYSGRKLSELNQVAVRGMVEAHEPGGVPCLLIEVPRLDAYYFGYLVYFFQRACAMSGFLQGVNPFDQPGVDIYKRNTRLMMMEKWRG